MVVQKAPDPRFAWAHQGLHHVSTGSSAHSGAAAHTGSSAHSGADANTATFANSSNSAAIDHLGNRCGVLMEVSSQGSHPGSACGPCLQTHWEGSPIAQLVSTSGVDIHVYTCTHQVSHTHP